MKKVIIAICLVLLICMYNGCTKKDNDKINELIMDIDNLPSEITLNDETKVDDLYQKYLTLNEDEKKQITNYSILSTSIARIKELKETDIKISKAKAVDELIIKLPNSSELSLSDENEILNARNSYNALTNEEKTYITKLESLQLIENKLIQLKMIKQLVDEITNLPEVNDATLNDKEIINNIYNKYQTLSNEEKTMINNYNKLNELHVKMICLEDDDKKSQIIIELINSLPSINNIKLTDETLIEEVREAYDQLTSRQQTLVVNVLVLDACEKQIVKLKEEANEAQIIKLAIDTINALPLEINLVMNDEEQVINARNEYNSLTSSQQLKVDNINKLEQCEEKLLEKYKAIENVSIIIDKLPNKESLTLEDEKTLTLTRNAYDSLNSDEKPFVDNYEILVILEAQMEKLKKEETQKQNAKLVDDMIKSLPTVDELKLTDEDLLSSTRMMYNALTTAEKNYVINYQTLVELENKMIILINNNPKNYIVTFYLDGGILEGATKAENQELLVSLNINYYSTGYWSYYQTEVIIFKTSLIAESDLYTSAYKLGFSYDSDKKEYLIDQIIANGTSLSNNNKTSEYFIFVHPDNTKAFSDLVTLNLGDVIVCDKTLPNSNNSELDLIMKVYSKSSIISESYQKAYNGYNTLEIPTKEGFKFVGWYDNEDFNNEKIVNVQGETTLYAKWVIDKGEIDINNILNTVSDVATSDTIDDLPSNIDGTTLTWSSSNNKLYVIANQTGTVSKIYQTHKKQIVTISVKVDYQNGSSETLSKEITINPVLYKSLSSTPIATYFATSSASSYKTYNERYKKEGTLFSETTKQTLDIIYYSFILLDATGNCWFADTSYMDEVLKLKENDVRIIGCVNGVSYEASKAFDTISSSETLRANFINNLMNLAEKYNLDGFDLDWESVAGAYVKANGISLLTKDLRQEMNNRQDEGGTPYQLSIAVPASSWGTASDRYDFVTLNKYLDYINIMSYDMNKTDVTTHLSPLYISSNDKGYNFGCAYGINRLTSLGFDRSKLIIGCAGYGKAYKVTGTSSNSKYPGLGATATLTQISGYAGSFASGTVYGNVITSLIATGKYTKYIEYNNSGQIVGSYLYNSTDKIFVTYDSEEIIIAKYNYANSMTGVGMMCWCYCEDSSDNYINSIAKVKK